MEHVAGNFLSPSALGAHSAGMSNALPVPFREAPAICRVVPEGQDPLMETLLTVTVSSRLSNVQALSVLILESSCSRFASASFRDFVISSMDRLSLSRILSSSLTKLGSPEVCVSTTLQLSLFLVKKSVCPALTSHSLPVLLCVVRILPSLAETNAFPPGVIPMKATVPRMAAVATPVLNLRYPPFFCFWASNLILPVFTSVKAIWTPFSESRVSSWTRDCSCTVMEVPSGRRTVT